MDNADTAQSTVTAPAPSANPVYVFGASADGSPALETIMVTVSEDDYFLGKHYEIAQEQTTLEEPYVLADHMEIDRIADALAAAMPARVPSGQAA